MRQNVVVTSNHVKMLVEGHHTFRIAWRPRLAEPQRWNVRWSTNGWSLFTRWKVGSSYSPRSVRYFYLWRHPGCFLYPLHFSKTPSISRNRPSVYLFHTYNHAGCFLYPPPFSHILSSFGVHATRFCRFILSDANTKRGCFYLYKHPGCFVYALRSLKVKLDSEF